MACGLDLLSTLPAHLVDEISEADWAQEKGREQSCSLVGEFLAQQAAFKQLIDQLTQPEGSPLQKYLDGADDWKKKGNEAFRIGAWQKAVECYTKALQYAPDDGGLLAPLFSNRAAALEKMEETAAALVDCSRAIEANPQFSKAWYRRGKAKAASGDLFGAVDDFEKALRIENGEDLSASHPDRESAPAGVGRSGEAAALSSSGEPEALEGSRRKLTDGAQEAGKRKAVSGSAKQIASELERVRALLLKVKTAGGALMRNSDKGKIKQVEKQGVKNWQKGEMENAQVGRSALCAGVEVFHQQGKGRGLRTTKFFRPGDTVINEEPYAAVLLKGQRASHCHHCFVGLPGNPLPCRGCAGPLFCGETCRDAALGRCAGALGLSVDGSGIESNLMNGGASQRAGSDKPARTSSNERVCTQRKEELDGSEGASAREVVKSVGGGEGPAGGAFWWHAHECGGASWAAVLPPDVVLAVRMLARLQKEQSKAVKEPSAEFYVDSKVSSLCHHLSRVPWEERLALLVHACTAAWCSQSSHFKITPADVLLAIGQLRANVMAVNEVCWDEKRPVEQSGSPFTNGGAPSSSLGHGATVEPQERRSVPRAQQMDSEESVSRTGELQGEEQVRMGAQPTSRVEPSDSAARLSSTFEQVQLGQGLYPTASLLNHSCDPSTAVSFVGNKLVVRAVQGVKAGAELTLSYGPQKGEQRTTERRKWLWERYTFVCNCAACTGDQTSDVLMTGFQCPRAKCGGVVPQYSATGRFSFPSSGDTLRAAAASKHVSAVAAAPHVMTSLPDPETATPGGVIDTSGTGRLESHWGAGEGINGSGGGVCSDCHLDAPDVVCEECEGRLLCFECDSHVHQPRSKRRGAHVRKRLRGASSGGEPELVKRFEGLVVDSRVGLGGGLPQDDSLAMDSRDGSLKYAGEVAPSDLAKSKGVANVTTVKTSRATETVAFPKTSGSRGLPQTAGSLSYLGLQTSLLERSISNRIETHSSALEPPGGSAGNATVLKVERGRCTSCGAEMDVSEASARVEAAWAGVQGRMPYLKAAEEALEFVRIVLHALNRKAAEYEDHVAQACAQSGRFAGAHDHCCRSLKILEHHYPLGSLPLAHEYSKLASIARAAGKLEEAFEMSQKAGDILAAHYGQHYRKQDCDNVELG